jgi:predicted RNase H-like HicB family nuclease
VPKPDPDKLATEIKGMQEELKNLQEALAQLVDAMITEEKPGPKEIKKLETLKKAALTSQPAAIKTAKPKKGKSQRRKKSSEVFQDSP